MAGWASNSPEPLWRVWRSNGRYKLVHARDEHAAVRKVTGATKADRVYDRKHPKAEA